jgi:hypothetical protein
MTPPPEWLATLANEVAAQIEPLGPMGPLGCHYYPGPAGWEITVFAASTEVVGGPQDGRVLGARFEVNLKALISIFAEVTAMHWQSQTFGRQDELGAHLSIEGRYGEESVCVRIPAVSPQRFEPGRQKAHRRRWYEAG